MTQQTQSSADGGGGAPTRTVAPPTPAVARTRSRPALRALAIAIIALGIAGGWMWSQWISDTVPVVGVAAPIAKGQTIERENLSSVQVADDPGLDAIPIDQVDTIVGKRASTDLPAGGVVPRASVSDALVPASGHTIVGIMVTDGQAPATGVSPGATVRLVSLPAQQGDGEDGTQESDTQPEVTSGVVLETSPTADGSGVRVDVDVPEDQAEAVQVLAAQQRIAIVVDSQEE